MVSGLWFGFYVVLVGGLVVLVGGADVGSVFVAG